MGYEDQANVKTTIEETPIGDLKFDEHTDAKALHKVDFLPPEILVTFRMIYGKKETSPLSRKNKDVSPVSEDVLKKYSEQEPNQKQKDCAQGPGSHRKFVIFLAREDERRVHYLWSVDPSQNNARRIIGVSCIHCGQFFFRPKDVNIYKQCYLCNGIMAFERDQLEGEKIVRKIFKCSRCGHEAIR